MEDEQELIIAILKGVPLFADLGYGALKELTALFGNRTFNKGEVIFEEENPGNSMMVIVSGEVRITQKTGQNKEETLIVLHKGDFFGEMALLDNMPRSATAIAHTGLFLLEISREKFMTFVNKNPASGVKILLTLARNLSSRIREANTKIRAFVNLTQWI